MPSEPLAGRARGARTFLSAWGPLREEQDKMSALPPQDGRFLGQTFLSASDSDF